MIWLQGKIWEVYHQLRSTRPSSGNVVNGTLTFYDLEVMKRFLFRHPVDNRPQCNGKKSRTASTEIKDRVDSKEGWYWQQGKQVLTVNFDSLSAMPSSQRKIGQQWYLFCLNGRHQTYVECFIFMIWFCRVWQIILGRKQATAIITWQSYDMVVIEAEDRLS